MFRTRHLIVSVAIILFVISAMLYSRFTLPTSQRNNQNEQYTIVIDAGHGGEDGGAISCTGVLESQINLEIAIRLNCLLRFMGLNTVMIRTDDVSVYTEGNTLSQKKVSDLKERVRITNSMQSAILVSIHQNNFSDNRYTGAQVFYAPTNGSKMLAEKLQSNFISTINPDSKRNVKPADGIFLMQHVTCPAVLIECGFLSNVSEESMLRDRRYQQKVCSVIAVTLSTNLKDLMIT